ncbi:MAG: hypothetical protein ABIR79_11780 [Candidatus Binatia bacterium]
MTPTPTFTVVGRTATPVPPTPTGPTPSPTATPVVLSHYHCYEVALDPFATIPGVNLDDELGTSTVNVKRPSRFCNPASIDDEDPTAPSEVDHLTGYEMDTISSTFVPLKNVGVTNEFGTIVLDVLRPDRLLVPSAKSLSGAPQPLDPSIDHFQCYVTQGGVARFDDLLVDDQFGTYIADIKRPMRLCMAVDKNGEGVFNSTEHLMCYQIETDPQRSLYRDPFFIDNQLGPDTIAVTGPREICVPSAVHP